MTTPRIATIIFQSSFLTNLTPQEYTNMIEKGEVPVLDPAKASFFATTAKILPYAATFFFVLTCACIVNFYFRQRTKDVALFIASVLCIIACAQPVSALKEKVALNEEFTVISNLFETNQSTDAKKRLESIATYWRVKAQITKEGPKANIEANNLGKREPSVWLDKADIWLDKVPGIGSLETADLVHTLDTSWRYFQLQSAFYQAMADLRDQPIHDRRFEDIFRYKTPNLEAFNTLAFAGIRQKKTIEFLSINKSILSANEETNVDILSKVRALSESCFQASKPENPPDNDLKEKFVELLKLVPTKA